MASVLWAPVDALGAKDMNQWVTKWAEMGCPNESLEMTILGQSDLRMAWTGCLRVSDQSIKANQWRTQEVRNAECHYVSEIMRRNENSRSGQVLRAGLSYKMRRQQLGRLTIGGVKEMFAGITKDIVVEYQRSKQVGTEVAAIGKEYKQKVLDRAQCWAQMRNKHDIRAWTIRLEEDHDEVLMTLHESIPPRWFIAAFENKGLRLTTTTFNTLNYNMQDIKRVVYPSTGVPKFMDSGWEAHTDARGGCYAWMKMGCRNQQCRFDHNESQKAILRNIHLPERVSNQNIKKTNIKKCGQRVTLLRCGRAHGQRVNTMEQKRNGKHKRARRLALSSPDKGGRKRVRGETRVSWRYTVQVQRIISRRWKHRSRGSWRARARGVTGTAQLQHMYTGRETKGGTDSTRTKAWCGMGDREQCRLLKLRNSIAVQKHKEEKAEQPGRGMFVFGTEKKRNSEKKKKQNKAQTKKIKLSGLNTRPVEKEKKVADMVMAIIIKRTRPTGNNVEGNGGKIKNKETEKEKEKSKIKKKQIKEREKRKEKKTKTKIKPAKGPGEKKKRKKQTEKEKEKNKKKKKEKEKKKKKKKKRKKTKKKKKKKKQKKQKKEKKKETKERKNKQRKKQRKEERKKERN